MEDGKYTSICPALIAGTAKYLCTWQGWPESDKTWEKEEELPVDLVDAYKARIRGQYQAGV